MELLDLRIATRRLCQVRTRLGTRFDNVLTQPLSYPDIAAAVVNKES